MKVTYLRLNESSYASCRSLSETGDRWVDISILTGEVEKR